jgi:hypothetical protein
MITFILIFLAAQFNAIMDRTGDLVAFNASIFSDKDPAFWCREISWKYAKKIFGWKADAWHIAKSTMIILLVAGIVIYQPVFNPISDFFIMGAIWNASFNLGYKTFYKRT